MDVRVRSRAEGVAQGTADEGSHALPRGPRVRPPGSPKSHRHVDEHCPIACPFPFTHKLPNHPTFVRGPGPIHGAPDPGTYLSRTPSGRTGELMGLGAGDVSSSARHSFNAFSADACVPVERMTIARPVCMCVRMCVRVCARVCMCPVRQFNVQLYVEKVFIAQKTSEDRGGKVRKRVKGTELLVDFTGKEELGGGRGWRVGGRDGRGGEDTSPDRV